MELHFSQEKASAPHTILRLMGKRMKPTPIKPKGSTKITMKQIQKNKVLEKYFNAKTPKIAWKMG